MASWPLFVMPGHESAARSRGQRRSISTTRFLAVDLIVLVPQRRALSSITKVSWGLPQIKCLVAPLRLLFSPSPLRAGFREAATNTAPPRRDAAHRAAKYATKPCHRRRNQNERVAPLVSIPSAARRGLGSARSRRENTVADRTGKPVCVTPRAAAEPV